MKISLLISTYNWSAALELVLLSIKHQSLIPDEVLIADDGSTEETKLLISEFQKKTTIPILHVWHQDKGFRKSRILNLAIAESTCDYIIEIDGDCIMHKDFIKDHVMMSEKDTYLFGSRVKIKESLLPELFLNQKIEFSFFDKGIKKRSRNIRIPFLASIYKRQGKISSKLRGCNLSYWRKDFIAVNGYNEDFEGWGREDSELIIRMTNNKICGKRIRYAGIVYHIWHKVADQNRCDANNLIQERSWVEKSIWCNKGISQHLENKMD